MQTNVYQDKLQVAEKFSEYLVGMISARERLYIALSGGSTPKVAFDHLSANYQHLDWSRLHLFWGDERCVPPDHEESNYKMTYEHLISKIDIPKTNIHRIKGENVPHKEAQEYSQVLQNTLPLKNGVPQFDLVILGMGSDGHTASIFPHQLDLWHSKSLCEVADHPNTGQQRITLTGKIINHAREVAFLITGEDKESKVNDILNKKENSRLYPASLVAPASGKLHWFLDKAAAGH